MNGREKSQALITSSEEKDPAQKQRTSNNNSFFSSLPTDILMNIMLNLSLDHLAIIALVNKRLYRTINEIKKGSIGNFYWQQKFEQILLPEMPGMQLAKQMNKHAWYANTNFKTLCINTLCVQEAKNLTQRQKDLFCFIRSGDLEAIKNENKKMPYTIQEITLNFDNKNAIALARMHNEKDILLYFYRLIIDLKQPKPPSKNIPVHKKFKIHGLNSKSYPRQQNYSVTYPPGLKLRIASMCGISDQVEVLTNAGNSYVINDEDANGNTPICFASYYGHTEVVKQLIKAKANLDIDTTMNPLYVAIVNGHQYIVAALLDAGADFNGVNTKKINPPILVAINGGNIEIIKLLLTHQVNVNIISSSGHSPLDIAIMKGEFEIVAELLKYGAHCTKRTLELANKSNNKAIYTLLKLYQIKNQLSDKNIEHVIVEILSAYIPTSKYQKFTNYFLKKGSVFIKHELQQKILGCQKIQDQNVKKDVLREIIEANKEYIPKIKLSFILNFVLAKPKETLKNEKTLVCG